MSDVKEQIIFRQELGSKRQSFGHFLWRQAREALSTFHICSTGSIGGSS